MKLATSYQVIARQMADSAVLRYPRNKAKQTNGHDYTRTHPDVVRFGQAFQKELNRRNIPFYPFCFYRSFEWQRRLFKKRPRVTRADAGQSPHNFGCATDFIHLVKLWDLRPEEWDLIGVIGKEVARKLNIKVDWGGDWSFYDPAHWQLSDWKEYRTSHNEYLASGFNPDLLDDAAYFAKLQTLTKKRLQR